MIDVLPIGGRFLVIVFDDPLAAEWLANALRCRLVGVLAVDSLIEVIAHVLEADALVAIQI